MAPVTSLGQGLAGYAYGKHKIKRMDGLVQNHCTPGQKDQVHAKREKEPWLLVAYLPLLGRPAKQIIKIYRTRMQIEEGFRDCKAAHYGLGLSQNKGMKENRRSIMCLLAALATFFLGCIGTAGSKTEMAKHVRVNSSSKTEPYSAIFLARLLISLSQFNLSEKGIKDAVKEIKPYMETVYYVNVYFLSLLGISQTLSRHYCRRH